MGLGLGFGVGLEVSTIKEVPWPDGRPRGVVLTVLQLLCSKVQAHYSCQPRRSRRVAQIYLLRRSSLVLCEK